MTVTVEDAGPYEKLIAFSVSEQEIDSAKTSTARRISKDLKIAGFRPGKAPKPIVERTVGAARLRAETIDDLLPARVASALGEAELEPAVAPALESLDDGEDGVDVKVRVTLWPTLDSVPDHRERTVEVMSPEVTDEELTDQIDRMRRQFGVLDDHDGVASIGDYVTIDIAASDRGEDVPEARASQLVYEVGSGGFLEGIDEVLVGAAAGESQSFDGVLPEGFGDAAGRSVSFTVDVTQVRRMALPELTDEWVEEVSEFASVSELEVNLEERMRALKREAAARDFRVKALDELVDQVELDLPEALVRSEMEDIVHRFVHRLEREDIELADYLAASGIDQDQFVDDVRAQADRGIRTRLLLEAVAESEGIAVEEDELAAVVSALFPNEESTDIRNRLTASGGLESITGDILRNKALEKVLAEATAVDADGEILDLEIEEETGLPDSSTSVPPADIAVADVVAEETSGPVAQGIPLAGTDDTLDEAAAIVEYEDGIDTPAEPEA